MDEVKNDKKQADLDTILMHDIDQFGLYQLRTVALCAVIGIFVGIATNQFVFTAARINTRCLIRECEYDGPAEFAPYWIRNAVPGTANSFDNCNRFVGVDNSSTVDEDETCPARLFDQNSTESCNEYVYENTNTIVHEFDLGCDEWRRSLVGTARTTGMLFSLPITGYISDRWGRRVAMVFNAFNTAWIGIVRYWTGTYIGFTIAQFFEAALGFGCFSCAYIMSMELVGPKFRVGSGASVSIAFALGQMILAMVAWAVPNWRQLTLVLYIPQLITITYLWIMPESARWYMSKGRYEESEEVIKDAARVNKKELSDRSIKALEETVDRMKMAASKSEPWLITQVFKHKPILLRGILSPIWWISTMCVYYGLTINAIDMSGNRYVNFLAVAAVEIPGFIIAVLFMSRIGRKPVLIGGFWICAACMLGYIFLPDGYYGLSLSLYLIGKCSISSVMTTIHIYTIELYPTRHRHSLFAFSSMMGRFGNILAPLTPALAATVWEGIPFAIFGSLALLSGVLIFFTPETLGAKFPDTMEEAADIGGQTTKDPHAS